MGDKVSTDTDFEVLEKTDPEVADAIKLEVQRQHGQLEMIASENFASRAVFAATGVYRVDTYADHVKIRSVESAVAESRTQHINGW